MREEKAARREMNDHTTLMAPMKPIILSAFALAAIAGSTFGAMDESTIAAGLKSHDRALHIKDGWMRDPYIVLAPDGLYYLTGTTFQPGDPAEASDPYNLGLGKQSRVGWKAQVWRSRDLIKWEHLGAPFSLQDGIWFKEQPAAFAKVNEKQWRLWAPELHWLWTGGRSSTPAPRPSEAPTCHSRPGRRRRDRGPIPWARISPIATTPRCSKTTTAPGG